MASQASNSAEQQMLGALTDGEALGRGPLPDGEYASRDYEHPAAGWGAARSVGKVLEESGHPVDAIRAMFVMNHEDGGFDCPGCAWPDDPNGLHLDLCENGMKHVTWETTRDTIGRDFFAENTVSELTNWTDYELEKAGRLTEPLKYDSGTDRYVPIDWEDAFELVGETLRALQDPNQAAFYTSGRLSNEASFLYQWWVREYGTNNFPDCSNMCHEASGRALAAALATPKGTTDLEDWEQADAIWLLGDNAGTNAPRMLTWLAEADRRGAQLIHINPLKEAASRRTIVPHEFVDMATFHTTRTGTMNVQVRIGGDMALMRGVAKAVLETARSKPEVLDTEFLQALTDGFEEYRELCERTGWHEITQDSGIDEQQIRKLADIYIKSERTIVAWCLGITQHEHGVDTIREIVNVLLLRGNIGRQGAGPAPVRGHSNVQGNRTCGINNRADHPWLDRMEKACGIKAPREDGYGAVAAIEAMQRSELKVFVALGGNFALATPDTPATFAALQKTELTVQVSTKLNRSHLVHGHQALILPCLARTDIDMQASGPQAVSVEDSMAMVHLSRGMKKPESSKMRSECSIIAGMAAATLPKSNTRWGWYVEDYDRIRDTMADALEGFENFNEKARRPHGFRLPQPARERVFRTPSGKAAFHSTSLPDDVDPGEGRLTLATVRSHDQFNTTIYANNDRYRGIYGIRTVLLMNEQDMTDRDLGDFDLIDITSISRDGTRRTAHGFRAVTHDVPRSSTIGYMPELNVLCGLADISTQSDQPVTKHLIIEVAPQARTSHP